MATKSVGGSVEGEGSGEMTNAIREAAKASGLSVNRLSQESRISYAGLRSFLVGEKTLTLPLANRLAKVLGLSLVKTEEAGK